MHMPDVRLHEPGSVNNACDLLRQYSDRARVLAGGTDILVDLRQDRVTGVDHLVSLRRIPGLNDIEETADGLRIGAMVTPTAASRHERIRKLFPALVDAIGSMAGWQVRSLATMAGNIARAVPCSDLAPVFVVAGAEVQLAAGTSERRLLVRDCFVGPRLTVFRHEEILTHILLPLPHPASGLAYRKFALRGANAIAVAGVAAGIWLNPRGVIEEARIVLGAVAPTPCISPLASNFLAGKTPGHDVFAEAGRLASQDALPICDVRGSDDYRRDLVKALTVDALDEALERARKGEK
ncbi:MAG: FAD binding domain-containing protein [Proteobacteria bacterium]|nr:FAD binding domain-containing protein [Pseudomonadota bacterium]